MKKIFLFLFLSISILAVKLSFDGSTSIANFNFEKSVDIQILPRIISDIKERINLDAFGITQINNIFTTLIINVKELSGNKTGWFTFRIKKQNDTNELNISLISTSF